MNHTHFMKNAALFCTASIGGVLASLWGGWDVLLKALLICMAVDYITGVAVAVCGKSPKSETGSITSHAAVIGLIKKGFALLVVLVAAQLQTITGGEFIRNTVLLFFIGSEGISIIENGGLLGVPLPAVVKKWFELLRDGEQKQE